MNRHDYAYPFAIDAASNQAAQTRYEAHVAQMIRQVLLTDPGERINLPGFGCGLRRLLFAPNSDAMQATAKLLISQQLAQWLAGQIKVNSVVVLTPEASPGHPEIDIQAEFIVRIDYLLIETQTSKRTEVPVL